MTNEKIQPEIIGQLTADELKMMSEANAMLAQAQAVHAFVAKHLIGIYALGERDEIQSTGAIVRYPERKRTN